MKGGVQARPMLTLPPPSEVVQSWIPELVDQVNGRRVSQPLGLAAKAVSHDWCAQLRLSA